MAQLTDEQLAQAIGMAVLDAIKAYRPETQTMEPIRNEYMSAKQLSESFSKCLRTTRQLIDEIREQVRIGRYPRTAILEGCGVVVSVNVFIDYLANRKALQDPVASKYVPEYREVIP